MRESSPEPSGERSPVLSIGVMKTLGWEYYAREVADGLVVAPFEHRTSRALDPQLHSHCLVLNKVRDARDGSWRALHGRPIFEEAKTAGMLYQAALRAELTRRLGVAWGPVSEHGQGE